jgi:peroxiredoxin
MYKKYNQQGFNILGVSTDTNKKYLEDAIDQDKLEWTNVCNFKKWYENEVVQLYALRQQSENVLLDSSGKIIAKNIKGEKLQLKLEELFAN